RKSGVPSVLEAESMRAGIRLAFWFEGEAKRVYGLMDRAALDGELKELADYIAKQPGRKSSVRDVQRRWPQRYPKAADAENALCLLGDQLEWRPVLTGGRSSVSVTLVK